MARNLHVCPNFLIKRILKAGYKQLEFILALKLQSRRCKLILYELNIILIEFRIEYKKR